MNETHNIEYIDCPVTYDGCEGRIAIIIRNREAKEPTGDIQRSVTSLNSVDDPLQCLLLKFASGDIISKHQHLNHQRVVTNTQEVLIIRSGKVKAEFYSPSRKIIATSLIHTGDIVIILAGGHGFTMLEPTEIVEIKTGPYLGKKQDKVLF